MAVTLNATKHFQKSKSLALHSRCISSHSLSRRSTHSSAHAADNIQFNALHETVTPNHTTTMPQSPPLSILPLTSLLRSLVISSISSSPPLLRPSLKIMSTLAHSQSPLLNPDRNRPLRWLLKKTFYAQFCAGENAREVQRTVSRLKHMGFKGVMLGYAKEVVLDEKAKVELQSMESSDASELCIIQEILPWKKGSLETVTMTEPGDFVALKFTGAGSQALYELSRNFQPSPALEEAITAICDLAASRGVRLLFDAEQQSLQAGIDSWTLDYMRRYNKKVPGHAVVYSTYQCYLKAAPRILAEHISLARKEGFTLGAKLVRGAYLESDPRHLINDTKEETDANYDALAEGLMRRQYNQVLRPAPGEEFEAFPPVNAVLACHNHTSVRKAEAIRCVQAQKGEERIDMVYAQLQGMADEVSCELVQEATRERPAEEVADIPQAYKYLVWGTTGECMKYLLRRAHENKDAVQRTRENRDAMAVEVLRRVKTVFGLST